MCEFVGSFCRVFELCLVVQFVGEYVMSSDLVPYLVELLSKECRKEEGQDDEVLSLILSALINVAMMEPHALDGVVLEDVASRLYRLACADELKVASKAALILSHVASTNTEILQDLPSSL